MAKDSLEVLIPSKENVKQYVIIYGICLIPSLFVGVSEGTVSAFVATVEMINSVILAILGVVFTGYVFLQALINKQLLVRLINAEGKNYEKTGDSKMKETNAEFTHLMMLCLIDVMFNLFLWICVKSLPEEFLLFESIVVDTILAVIAIDLYLSINALILWETKGFIYNVFQLFTLHAAARGLEIIDEENKDTH